MLDQNTDRLWYVIGAIIIGGLILTSSIYLFDNTVFASASHSYRMLSKNAHSVGEVHIVKSNSDFSDYGEGWIHREIMDGEWLYDSRNDDVYRDGFAYLKNRDVARDFGVSNNARVKVKFRAKGVGLVDLRFSVNGSGGVQEEDVRSVELSDEYATYEVELQQVSSRNNGFIMFQVIGDAEMYLDYVDVWEIVL